LLSEPNRSFYAFSGVKIQNHPNILPFTSRSSYERRNIVSPFSSQTPWDASYHVSHITFHQPKLRPRQTFNRRSHDLDKLGHQAKAGITYHISRFTFHQPKPRPRQTFNRRSHDLDKLGHLAKAGITPRQPKL
ncbi:MAG TPA: hypothetical protein VFV37_08910, partial [Luteibaculaceae bacterium]|nr:hypothetical protein [Luteibaculaceae bacterium]